jgi:hypothetical protein
MALLHFELDIDSEVHPELYARLAALKRRAAREEKLRQLAATGLIWEIDRLHGPAFAEGAEMAEAGAASAMPAPSAPAAVDAGAVGDHVASAPKNVPVLFDVVDEADAAGAQPVPASVLHLGEAAPAALPPPPAVPPPPAAGTGKSRSARLKRMKDAGLFQNG